MQASGKGEAYCRRYRPYAGAFELSVMPPQVLMPAVVPARVDTHGVIRNGCRHYEPG